jgi:DsbC/DsbD-like thiol-disulfide interchange protein/cytochrome c biogenesis protein CcdA
MMFARLLLAAFTLLLSVPVLGQSGTHHMRVALVAESAHPASGKPLTLAIVMTPDAGWHGYWVNPGEAGFAPDLKWTLPDGVWFSKVRYPVPEKLVVGGLVNHVFNGPHALLADLGMNGPAHPDRALPIKLHVNLLVCTAQICVPESDDVAVNLSAGDGAADVRVASQFDQWRKAMPRPLEDKNTPNTAAARYQVHGKTLLIAIPYPADTPLAAIPWLYAEKSDIIVNGGAQHFRRTGDWLVGEVEAGAGALDLVRPGRPDGPDWPVSFPAILSIGAGNGLSFHAMPGAVPSGGRPVVPQSDVPSPVSFIAVLAALGGALVGGLILNIMPCVFPIIGLKALSLAKGGQDEAIVRRESLAYTGGIILTVLALGGLMLALRAAGHAVGWAFQLQNPWVIGALLIVVLGITANLLGLFELPSFGGGDGLTRKGGVTGSFWTGALAAFVATPCTGPFMAAALGAALVLPTYAALMIFAGLGLGMAAPFLALGYIPAVRTRLPKPGAWMNTFRRIMALPMALTALALVWLLWKEAVPQTQMEGIVNAQPFSEARLADLRAHHRPAFVYFTADWCLTCKVNEKAAIETQAVADSFKAHHIAVLEGDWTHGDPAITRFLEAHGRSGVPLYLYYPADGGEGRDLPQVLSVATLTGL